MYEAVPCLEKNEFGKFLGIQVMNGQKKSSHTHGMYRQVGNWETFAAHAFSGLHFRNNFITVIFL